MSDSAIPAELPMLYANFVRVGMSYTDIRLYFGENLPTDFSNEPGVHVPGQKIVDRLCIVVSPELLPQLAKGFADAVNNYQSNFGKLRPQPQNVTIPQTGPLKG
jgi:hypothetical protein